MKRKRIKGDDPSALNPIVDIVSNALGMIILIMIVISLLSFTRSYFSGAAEQQEVLAQALGDEVGGMTLPHYREESTNRIGYFVLCRYEKLYFLDMAEIYQTVISNFQNDRFSSRVDLEDFVLKMSPTGNSETNEWKISFLPLSEGGVSPETSDSSGVIQNKAEILEHFHIYDEELNPDGVLHPEYHYFYFGVFEDSFSTLIPVAQMLIEMGFSVGTQVMSSSVYGEGGVTLSEDVFFGEKALPVQYQGEG